MLYYGIQCGLSLVWISWLLKRTRSILISGLKFRLALPPRYLIASCLRSLNNVSYRTRLKKFREWCANNTQACAFFLFFFFQYVINRNALSYMPWRQIVAIMNLANTLASFQKSFTFVFVKNCLRTCKRKCGVIIYTLSKILNISSKF